MPPACRSAVSLLLPNDRADFQRSGEMIRHILLSVMAAAGAQAGAGAQVRVFTGARVDRSIRIPTRLTGSFLDLVYDGHARRLYTYFEDAGGLRLVAWDRSGNRLPDWDVPPGLRPASLLYRRSGHVTGLVRAGTEIWEATFEELPRPAVALRELDTDPADYDYRLDRRTFVAVRSLMKELHLVPSLRNTISRSGGGVAFGHMRDLSRLIDRYPINAPDVYWDRLGWTDDLSMISQGSLDGGNVRLEVKQSDQQYRSFNLDSQLQGVFADSGKGPRFSALHSIVLGANQVIYGISEEPRAGQPPPSRPRRRVVWLKPVGTGWRVVRTEKGLLARRLQRFGEESQ